ncbi:MAG TPA: IS66 family transposase [Streptosporangiaceae bacterium]
MPDVPGVPSAAELERLPHAELAALLAGAYQLIGQLRARVEHLERAAGKDSATSSRPPSSDSPYKKKPRDRSLRERGKRRPGKQPGEPGTTLMLADDPDERLEFPPACCRGCGAGLAGVPVVAERRHQVTDVAPPPRPRVTEYVAQARACPCCGTVSEGVLPGHVRARASYGPEAHAQAANLTCGHHVPVGRAAVLLAQMAGLAVSAGWMAGIRGKAAALIEASGFAGRVRDLLAQAPAVHADETPARAAGGLRYVHLACTPYLALMHTGDRSAAAIDAGGVLPGYRGILVRDGYHGYWHLAGAAHAWCAAHLLRDLKGVHDAEPGRQEWAAKMACLLLWARDTAAAARRAGQAALDPAFGDDLAGCYQAAAAEGITASLFRHGTAPREGRALARRFQRYQDDILRFVTRPDLDIFTNNEAERTIRPVKVQQRSSGGCWRTLQGLADFAIVQSCLSTATRWGLSKIDALRALFQGHPWIPPGLAPAG